MMKAEAVFLVAETMSPELAAELSNRAAKWDATVTLECDGRALLLNSLISLLAVPLKRGMRLTIVSDGAQAEEALNDVRAYLENVR